VVAVLQATALTGFWGYGLFGGPIRSSPDAALSDLWDYALAPFVCLLALLGFLALWRRGVSHFSARELPELTVC